MKLRIAAMLTLLVCCTAIVSAWADWFDPVYVTDPLLKQELIDYAYQEMAQIYPRLTAEQRAAFVVTDVAWFPNTSTWKVWMIYKNCETVIVYFDIARNTEGMFYTQYHIPWDIESLVTLFDQSISAEEALVIGHLSLANAICDSYQEYPDKAKAFVDIFGLSILEPANFVVEMSFCSPLNGGSRSDGVYWSMYFAVPFDAEAGADWSVNSLWYDVDVDAATGKVLRRNTHRMFSAILH